MLLDIVETAEKDNVIIDAVFRAWSHGSESRIIVVTRRDKIGDTTQVFSGVFGNVDLVMFPLTSSSTPPKFYHGISDIGCVPNEVLIKITKYLDDG